MRWQPGGQSPNVEDRRGQRGFGGGMAPMGIGGVVVLLVLSLIFGRDFVLELGDDTATSGGEVAPVAESPAEHNEVKFV